MKEKVNVAVYGSLRKGFHNHRLLENENCNFIGFAKTKPEYTLFPISSFPGIKKNGNTSVLVEIYEVDKKYLPFIDSLEGYREGETPTFYDRQSISVDMDGLNVETYIYEYVRNNTNTIIESGDWSDYFKIKK